MIVNDSNDISRPRLVCIVKKTSLSLDFLRKTLRKHWISADFMKNVDIS